MLDRTKQEPSKYQLPSPLNILRNLVAQSQNSTLQNNIDFEDLTIAGVSFNEYEFVQEVVSKVAELLCDTKDFNTESKGVHFEEGSESGVIYHLFNGRKGEVITAGEVSKVAEIHSSMISSRLGGINQKLPEGERIRSLGQAGNLRGNYVYCKDSDFAKIKRNFLVMQKMLRYKKLVEFLETKVGEIISEEDILTALKVEKGQERIIQEYLVEQPKDAKYKFFSLVHGEPYYVYCEVEDFKDIRTKYVGTVSTGVVEVVSTPVAAKAGGEEERIAPGIVCDTDDSGAEKAPDEEIYTGTDSGNADTETAVVEEEAPDNAIEEQEPGEDIPTGGDISEEVDNTDIDSDATHGEIAQVAADISGDFFRMSHKRRDKICGEISDFDLENYMFCGVELKVDEFIFCLLCVEDQDVGIDESEIRNNLIAGENMSWRDFLQMRSRIAEKIGDKLYVFEIEDTSIILKKVEDKVRDDEQKTEEQKNQKKSKYGIIIGKENFQALIDAYPTLSFDNERKTLNGVDINEWAFNLALYCLHFIGQKHSFKAIYETFMKKELQKKQEKGVFKQMKGFIGVINSALGENNKMLHITHDDENMWIGDIEIEEDIVNQGNNDTETETVVEETHVSRFEIYMMEQSYDFGDAINFDVTGVDVASAPTVGFLVGDKVIEIEFSQVEYIFFSYLLSKNGQAFTIQSLYAEFSSDEPLKSSAEFGHFYTEVKNSINVKLRQNDLEDIYGIGSPNNKESIAEIYEQYDKGNFMFIYNRVTHELRWSDETIVLSDEYIRGNALRFLRSTKVALNMKVKNAEIARSIEEGFQKFNLPFSVSIEGMVTLHRN